jgi:putative hydrolase of the HAD superfamily
MTIRAVAFDIDGTLYPNIMMYLRSVLFSLGTLRFLYHYGQVRKKIRTVRPIDDFRATQARMLAEALGIPEERAARMIHDRIYTRWQRIFRGMRPFPHLAEFLGKLREWNVKIGVLSDFPVGDKLEYLGLGIDWDCVISAEDTGYLKPNPEPFTRLAECFGVEPAEILFIGNNYEYMFLERRGWE